ncbi:hypothetical protein HO173_002479 [Letharia columbiana]|uniref:Uncharacterized protein n=1 Tax=Letharia columbiana TaxID=112416 RepID=A0A8H6G2I9_9LECA|nr:uncharacterized protein HO173_002479 [Letharia columbiana]KAF6239218.1 hypothetical protein HO173_002479 [Letharia columbiana]
MDYIRTLTQRSASETRVGDRKSLSTPPSRPNSPTSPHSRSSPSTPRPRTPNTDALPGSAGALEGLLNARSSQLQKLADRVESVNEWLEMDGIVLAKLIHDIGAQVGREEEAERAGREAAERALALWKENNPSTPAASKGPVSPGQYRGVNAGSSRVSSGEGRPSSGESRVPEVFLKGMDLGGKSKEERVNENCGVRDLRERIKGMKKWRREIERTVCWQREEYRRVQKAINRQSNQSEESGVTERGVTRRVVQFEDDENVEGRGKDKEGAEPVKITGVHRDEGWGVGGQTWEKKSGKVPSQSEWEELFSDGRIGWDDKGIRRRHLGC